MIKYNCKYNAFPILPGVLGLHSVWILDGVHDWLLDLCLSLHDRFNNWGSRSFSGKPNGDIKFQSGKNSSSREDDYEITTYII